MHDVVITGLGIACPLGIGREAVWSAVEGRRSGIRPIAQQVEARMPSPFGGEVPDFQPKAYVKPRKSLKVMSRETQLGFTAARLAWTDAGLDRYSADPARLGIVCAANMFSCELPDVTSAFQQCTVDGGFDFSRWGQTGMREIFPLFLLKYLPNMSACHIGIALDIRGPINTIVQGDTSALHALIEAATQIARGDADLMIAGGTSSTVTFMDQMWHRGAECRPEPAPLPRHVGHSTQAATVPWPARGLACWFWKVVSMPSRTARIMAKILGYGRRCEPCAESQRPTGQAVRQAADAALAMAGLDPRAVGHVNAHGLSTLDDDALEARAIRQVLGAVPVTAPKSFLGNSGAGSGAIELALSLLGMEHGVVPPTLNYERPDPDCPVEVVTEMQPARSQSVLALNHKLTGQAVALLVEAED